ncbi:uncharacterized protein LOC107462791 [Arachis duranensis]|uniref:Uncharacterized protein LOC107462791 n=1 Tax=Arachis duranensis TaxID=130453 RepID=A0A6P4BXP7_ARADU|nr:uncharacterized protein LOC107462791 [Arachis duranensis]
MAFHVACPITCRRICTCPLGFLRGPKNEQQDDVVSRLQDFLRDPAGIAGLDGGGLTVQVAVPKVVPQPQPPPPRQVLPSAVDEADEAASVQAKRAALQRKGAAAMVAAEEYARRFESGDVTDTSGNHTGEEQGQSNVFCRMCNRVENNGSERAKKMLSCKSCGKKYHRNCLRSWAQNRDLFHWSSWTCRSCRICEACRRTGDPSKFMFCKRCDGAYHCYCLQPPHKNVSTGPYLCPKHTRCHSCGSNVPGNGPSLRWFLGYTCCDACGRLFLKGNYCPVCLKVYRESESTPMVCCDICQHWVHCQCDNISDEKYQQFQVDGNLQYQCPTCRGECYQIKNHKDAVQELWRRRDVADRNLIASLRAAAGLPTQEEIFCISPYSDDEDSGLLKLKSESGHSLKFYMKNLSGDSTKKMKDYGKKHSSGKNARKKDLETFIDKIDAQCNLEGHSGLKSLHGFDDDIQSHENELPNVYSSPAAGSMSQTEGSCPVNQPVILRHKSVDEASIYDEERRPRVVRIKSSKAHTLDSAGESGKPADMTQNVKGKKLVINLGARKINVSCSPQSNSSSCPRDQAVIAHHGNRIDSGQSQVMKGSVREGNVIKLGKFKPEISELNSTSVRGSGSLSDGCEAVPSQQPHIMLGKDSTDGIDQVGAVEDMPQRGERMLMGKFPEGTSHADKNINQMPSHSSTKDPRTSLRFKLKKPSFENGKIPHQDKSSIKGQRSKRKRPPPYSEKTSFNEDDVTQLHQDNLMDEIMDANWILTKLGKDAIGKRVEVHQAPDNSWHKGVITDIIDGSSNLYVTIDDGRVKILELGKQGIRLVPQEQKRPKT